MNSFQKTPLMTDDFIAYQKFTDIESAESFAAELKANNILYHLENNNHSYVKVYGYQPIDFAIIVNIKQSDFAQADNVLDNYYKNEIEKIDKGYYVFEMSDEELKGIINHPFEWGRLDFQLAKYLLKEKGIEISENEIEKIKFDQLHELTRKQPVNIYKIFLGYALAFTLPIFSVFIGISIYYNRKILPNGEKFYIHPDKGRIHGKIIIIISIVWPCSLVLYEIFFKN